MRVWTALRVARGTTSDPCQILYRKCTNKGTLRTRLRLRRSLYHSALPDHLLAKNGRQSYETVDQVPKVFFFFSPCTLAKLGYKQICEGNVWQFASRTLCKHKGPYALSDPKRFRGKSIHNVLSFIKTLQQYMTQHKSMANFSAKVPCRSELFSRDNRFIKMVAATFGTCRLPVSAGRRN